MRNIKIYYVFVALMFTNFSLYAQGDSPPDIVTKVATCAANWLKLETKIKKMVLMIQKEVADKMNYAKKLKKID